MRSRFPVPTAVCFIPIGRCVRDGRVLPSSRDERDRVDDRGSGAAPVRNDLDLPPSLRTVGARAGAARGNHADALVPDGRRGLAPADPFFRDPLPDQLRDRRRDRARAGVRVRDELVGLLEIRRQRLRRAARDRGLGRVLPRVDLPRALDLRLEQALATPTSRHALDRRARHLALGLLHPRRELVDATPGRLQARQRRGAADQRVGALVERVRLARLPAHDARRPDLRLDRDAGHLLLALPARPRRRHLPQGGEAGADRRGAGHPAPTGGRQPLRGGCDERAEHEDRRLGGAVEHLRAVRLLALPDRRVLGAGSDPELLDHRPESPVVYGHRVVRRHGPRTQSAPGPGAEEVRPRQLHAEYRGDLLVDAGDGLPRRADVGRRRGRCVALLEAETRAGAMVPLDGDRRNRIPVHRCDVGLDPHRDGTAAVDRAGATPDQQGELAERQRNLARRQPWFLHHPLRRSRRRRLRADAPLRAARPAVATGGAAGAGGDLLMDLQIFWFCLIAVLWGGYFLLEGFDFGVGMLLPFLPRDERERGAMLQTIGPVWDGNEVWLVVAGGATFAAFPAWYATMFSGFYLALLLILVLLIVRVVSFEWRDKSDNPRWRAAWMWAAAGGRR